MKNLTGVRCNGTGSTQMDYRKRQYFRAFPAIRSEAAVYDAIFHGFFPDQMSERVVGRFVEKETMVKATRYGRNCPGKTEWKRPVFIEECWTQIPKNPRAFRYDEQTKRTSMAESSLIKKPARNRSVSCRYKHLVMIKLKPRISGYAWKYGGSLHHGITDNLLFMLHTHLIEQAVKGQSPTTTTGTTTTAKTACGLFISRDNMGGGNAMIPFTTAHGLTS